MHAAVIDFHTLEVYARSIYSCGMEPEVAKYHLGALALAVADSIASVSASFSPSGPLREAAKREPAARHISLISICVAHILQRLPEARRRRS